MKPKEAEITKEPQKTPEALQAQLEALKEQRMNDCLAEVTAIMEKYQCEFQPETIIRGTTVDSRVVIVAK